MVTTHSTHIYSSRTCNSELVVFITEFDLCNVTATKIESCDFAFLYSHSSYGLMVNFWFTLFDQLEQVRIS
jgi:hypothetical protein